MEQHETPDRDVAIATRDTAEPSNAFAATLASLIQDGRIVAQTPEARSVLHDLADAPEGHDHSQWRRSLPGGSR
jgi:hypothetical protein